MKILLTFILVLCMFRVNSQSNDYASLIEKSQMRINFNDGEKLDITKGEAILIKSKWIKSVFVWTSETKKKELEYFGDKPLIILILKKRKEDDFLELLKKIDLKTLEGYCFSLTLIC